MYLYPESESETQFNKLPENKRINPNMLQKAMTKPKRSNFSPFRPNFQKFSLTKSQSLFLQVSEPS